MRKGGTVYMKLRVNRLPLREGEGTLRSQKGRKPLRKKFALPPDSLTQIPVWPNLKKRKLLEVREFRWRARKILEEGRLKRGGGIKLSGKRQKYFEFENRAGEKPNDKKVFPTNKKGRRGKGKGSPVGGGVGWREP